MPEFGWQETGENPLAYYRRVRGQQSIRPDLDAIAALLPREGETLCDFAKRVRQRRIGKKRASVAYVAAICNLVFHKDFSEDYYFEILMDATASERRHAQVLRAKARYREKNREILSKKQLARYYKKKNES